MLRCKRCLLYEMADSAQYNNVYEYIRQIDADLKVEDAEYQRRLSICKECDQLLSGMCRVCGCFVELRALMKQKNCPSEHHYW